MQPDDKLIENYIFGEFTIKGTQHSALSGVGKDIRLIGDEVSKWSERKNHVLNFEMVTGIFDKGIDTLIIGNGHDGVLQVSVDIVEEIKKKGIPNVIVEKTGEAVKDYNTMFKEGKKVAMLAHGTC